MTSPTVILRRAAVSSASLAMVEAAGAVVRYLLPLVAWFRLNGAGLFGSAFVVFGIWQIYRPLGWIALGGMLITRDVVNGLRELAVRRIRSGGGQP